MGKETSGESEEEQGGKESTEKAKEKEVMDELIERVNEYVTQRLLNAFLYGKEKERQMHQGHQGITEGGRALVVLSGGLDSCVALALARTQNAYVETVTFLYGQKHEKEVDSAQEIAGFYNVPHSLYVVPISKGGALTDSNVAMPHATYEELQEAQGPSPTYVPYRNGCLLSLSASHALERDLDKIYAGMHGEDAHNWAYPDCTPEFIGAMQNAIYIGTYMKVRLICPFTYKMKREIIELGLKLGAPLRLTWSCYEGGEVHCGKCPTCVARLEAFRQAGKDDPVRYEFDKYRGHAV